MIAIAQIGGHQAIVSKGDILEVDKLKVAVGEKISFETLLISEEDGSNFEIGAPFLSQKVEAKIIEHGRGSKIRIFKMKPRKRYRRTQGHRQDFTTIEIINIGKAKATKATSPKPTTKEKTKKSPAKDPQ